jgi:hypothetical protein
LDHLNDIDAALRIVADTTTPESAAQAVASCVESLGDAQTMMTHCVGSTLAAHMHQLHVINGNWFIGIF